ncbi:MAG: ATP-binding protein, partial [Candidatus Aenigmarchaeota archaeon]|nr:ATP-binding protein [Candidatus Aenigmarchaeota archaeon]
FKTNIIMVKDPNMSEEELDIRKYMKPGEITVFVMSKLRSVEIDTFVRRSIQKIFSIQWPEARGLNVLVVYDEMHRLLPKYGGKSGYVELERGCREFRKWGIGLYLISQVLSDFKGAIRANIATETQLRTKYNGDINRVKQKFGTDYAERISKLTIGTGLAQNPEYNDGKPWFVTYRPLLHDTGRLSEEELTAYTKVKEKIDVFEERLSALKKAGKDVYDIEVELKMAREKMSQGLFKMAETYIQSIEVRIKNMGG